MCVYNIVLCTTGSRKVPVDVHYLQEHQTHAKILNSSPTMNTGSGESLYRKLSKTPNIVGSSEDSKLACSMHSEHVSKVTNETEKFAV